MATQFGKYIFTCNVVNQLHYGQYILKRNVDDTEKCHACKQAGWGGRYHLQTKLDNLFFGTFPNHYTFHLNIKRVSCGLTSVCHTFSYSELLILYVKLKVPNFLLARRVLLL